LKFCGHCDRPHHDIPNCGKPAKYVFSFKDSSDTNDQFVLCAEHGDNFTKSSVSKFFNVELINAKLAVML